MKVNKKELNKALKVLKVLLPNKVNHPAQGMVSLVSDDGILHLTASSAYDQSASTKIPCSAETTWGYNVCCDQKIQGCFPIKVLLELSKGKGELEIEHKVIVSINDVPCDPTDSYTCNGIVLNSISCFEYPVIQLTDNKELISQQLATEFQSALSFVLPSVSKDVYRDNLTYIHFSDKALTATNGHTMHKATLSNEVSKSVLIPIEIAEIITKLSFDREDRINFSLKGNTLTDEYLEIELNSWKLLSKIPATTFPDCERVLQDFIEESFPITVTQEIAPLQKAIHILKSAGDISHVKLTLTDHEFIVSNKENRIVLQDNMNNSMQFASNLNPVYLLNAIANGDQTIQLTPSDSSLGENNANMFIQLDNDTTKTAIILSIRD